MSPPPIESHDMLAPSKSKRDAAIDAARRGFNVFPVVPNTKKPAIQKWQFAATRNEGRIIAWWTENPDYNIGIRMDGLATLAIDPRNGGVQSFEELLKTETITHTLVAQTAGGGHHIIYRLPAGVKLSSGKDKFGPGIDLKTGAGAYLVAAGSTIDGKAYEWFRDRSIVEAPQWVIERAKKRIEKSPDAGKRLVEEDDSAVARATRYIEGHAPEATPGNRDNTAYQVAARLYDFGVSKTTARDLMHGWNEDKCQPPLSIEEIERVADSGGRNRQMPIGVEHRLNNLGFEVHEIAPKNKPKQCKEENTPKSKFYYLRADEGSKRALDNPREWLIENVLHRGGEAVLIGAPGGGKTFFGLD